MPFFTMQQVSSTYLFQSRGLEGAAFSASSSKNSMYRFATTAETGETVRRLETRMKEHRDACQKGALEKSALAEHAWENHHPIKWEEPR